MRALDTNVVVRIMTADDAAQFEAARAAVLAGPCLVTATVLIETEWVLRAAYRWSRADIATALASLLDLSGIIIEQPALMAWAVACYRAGADFADMVHLAGARHATAFLTFDRKLPASAGPDLPVPVVLL